MLQFQLVLSLLLVLPSTEEHDYDKDKAPTPYLLQFCRNFTLVSTYQKGEGVVFICPTFSWTDYHFFLDWPGLTLPRIELESLHHILGRVQSLAMKCSLLIRYIKHIMDGRVFSCKEH